MVLILGFMKLKDCWQWLCFRRLRIHTWIYLLMVTTTRWEKFNFQSSLSVRCWRRSCMYFTSVQHRKVGCCRILDHQAGQSSQKTKHLKENIRRWYLQWCPRPVVEMHARATMYAQQYSLRIAPYPCCTWSNNSTVEPNTGEPGQSVFW